MNAFPSLIGELETAMQSGAADKRATVLRKVTELFLVNSSRLQQDQVEIFGDVLGHLMKAMEGTILAEVSARLAPIDNAPRAVIGQLARHEEIGVAGPVLSHSGQLSDSDLVEIASTKGQEHLAAISDRKRLASAVTDILVERGDGIVLKRVSRNAGASFSDVGFKGLARHAESDADLAGVLAARVDLPRHVLQDLAAQATDVVRARLIETATPDRLRALEEALAAVSNKVIRQVTAPRDYSKAKASIAKMYAENKLNSGAILSFASTGQYELMIAGFAHLCSASTELIEQLMQNPRADGVVIACKAAELSWPVLATVLNVRFPMHPVGEAELEDAHQDFLKLSPATAQRMLRFWTVRGVAMNSDSSIARPS